MSHVSHIPYTLLIASVRKGRYRCPRCLIPVWKFRDMGMSRDKKAHDKLGRKDDFKRRHMVADARKAIYQGRYAVDGEKVNKILGEQSLVPIAVCINFQLDETALILLSRMLFLRSCQNSVLIYFQCLLLTSCMSSNRGFGRRFSFTCFAYLILKVACSSMN